MAKGAVGNAWRLFCSPSLAADRRSNCSVGSGYYPPQLFCACREQPKKPTNAKAGRRSSLPQFDRQRAGDDRWKPAMPNAFILRSLTYCRRDYAAPLQLETPEFALVSGWGAQK
jgi:hypothetical protein